MRFSAAILLGGLGIGLAVGLAGCGGSRAQPAATAGAGGPGGGSGSGPLACSAWPGGSEAWMGDPQVVRSDEQDLPGTEDDPRSPVSVVVGYVCVTLPSGRALDSTYCGAADGGRAPQSCQVGQECGIGSIMVTEIEPLATDAGTRICATFENWARRGVRRPIIWARTR